MKKRLLTLVVLFSISLLSNNSHLNAQAFIDVESGALFSGYNDVRIPGDGGTKISLSSDLEVDPSFFYRFRAGYTINSKHTISVLYAPLKVKPSGSVDFPVEFEGQLFPANTLFDASYKFNSYRITYRYDFIMNPKFQFGLGLTGKIRDAEIELVSDNLTATKKNVGFVPLINFRLNWQYDEKFGLLFQGDALAAKQGRAEDVMLAGTYKFSDELAMRLGYRILEGGADNDEVYNFSLFHYASLGVTYTFKQ